MTNVVHLPLSHELRKGMRVVDSFDRGGEIVGFTRGWTWAYRKPVVVAWVIVLFDFDGHRRYMRAEEIRVVETTAPVHETEAPDVA